MLKQPMYRYFPAERVSAYQDCTKWWKFYLVPDYVTLRRDENGNPVFQLVKYAFGDQDREENPNLPRGGGYMNFDVELRVEPAHQATITAQLQADVDRTWHELKAVAARKNVSVQGLGLSSWHNLNDQVTTGASLSVDDVLLGLGEKRPEAPPGDRSPAVELAEPTWTEGTFRVTAPQSDALVSNRVAEGPVSLLGNNVVSVSMDLTSAGATFMQKTLMESDGSGGSDLTPIQVRYELKCLARVPPVDLSITADSRSLHMAIDSLYHDFEDRGCDPDAITHSEHHLNMAVHSGLITIAFDTGTLALGDDFIQEMRTSALTTVKEMVKDTFFQKQPAPPPKPEEKDFTDRNSDIYIFKSTFESGSMHIEHHERVEGMQQWPMNPQGTLQAFFAGMPPEEMRTYVRLADLDDPYFKTLGLKVTAFADWEEDEIAFVECQVHYEGTDEEGAHVEKDQSFTLTKDTPNGAWDPSLIGAKREYEYRYRVAHEGRQAGEWTRWEKEARPHLNFNVAAPGRIKARVLAGNLDFQQIVQQAQLEIAYADASAGVPEQGTRLVLNAGQGEQTYQRMIYVPQRRPLRYRQHFFLKNGQSVSEDWKETTSDTIVVNEPDSVNKLDVQVMPAGDWSEVQRALVDLFYEDASNGYQAEGSVSLTSPDEFRRWMAVVKDPRNRRFRYRTLITYKNGATPDDSGFVEANDDQTLLVVAKAPPKLAVKLSSALVDFKATPVVEAALRYDDDANGVHESKVVMLTAPGEEVWSVPIRNRARKSYKAQITYNRADDDPVPLPEQSTDRDVIVIQKLKVPEVTALLIPKLVNFVETPVVEALIEYDDGNGTQEVVNLVFTDNVEQRFRVPVSEGAPRTYDLTVTHWLADGTPKSRPKVTLSQPSVIVPRYSAAKAVA
jgi:hypothetical protein